MVRNIHFKAKYETHIEDNILYKRKYFVKTMEYIYLELQSIGGDPP